ncbi:MAG: (d)CMP kinase [Deltaproteobacteria bacterium]|nr:(d)CMP kinase [Deltaproteobacteria bacterium]
MRKEPIVAIDGPSGVGKSTVAKGVAKKLNFQFVDTGALYRTVALTAKKENIDLNDGDKVAKEALKHTFTFDSDGELYLDGEKAGLSIRNNEIAAGASQVAVHQEVREALLNIQRTLGIDGGVVLEGRDIGTVVFPYAETKFFLTASVDERAKRRYLQLKEQNADVSLEDVIDAQIKRDKQDTERLVAPLKKADDADEVNCEIMSAEDVVNYICDKVQIFRKK